MKFNSIWSRTLQVLAACGALCAPSAKAATSADGDLFLGVRATGGTGATKDVVINLGQASQFTSGSGFTLSLGSLGSDLTTIFGSGWQSRTDLFWGIAGSTGAFNGLGNDPAKTLFATRSRLSPGVVATPWTRRSDTAQGTTVSKVTSMMQAFNASASSGVAINSVQQTTTSTNSWASFQPGGTTANSGPAPGISFAAFNSTIEGNATGVLDLFRMRPATAAAPAGTAGDYLGTFTINASGVVSYAPASTPFYTLNTQSYTVSEASGTMSIVITREGDLTNATSVNFSTVNGTAVGGTDFTAVSNQTIEFIESQATATANVTVLNRAGINGTRVFTVALSGPVASVLGSSSTAQITVTESESGFAFSSSTASVSEAAGNAVLTINRTGRTDVSNSVTVNTANGTGVAGTDYTALSAVSVSFAAGETSKTVSVPVINRPGIRANRTFTATLSVAGSPLLTVSPSTATVTITEADQLNAQNGPSSSATPYLLPLNNNWQTRSVITVGDTFTKTGGGSYQMSGIADGLGAFDNGNNTFTLLMNHEFGNTSGPVRSHGSAGSFVSEWIIDKATLAVVSGGDLITAVYGWDTVNQVSNAAPGTFAFNRFCSADLPPVSAFYNPGSGLGTQERIFLNGEEGGATGWAVAHVASGTNKGKSYLLGKFNLATNLSGISAVGGWENLLANPYVQDKTVVVGTNDGGTGIMNNSVSVYVGTKTSSGTEADRAGLTNGVQKFINVTGNIAEIIDTTTRATSITSGTRFTLSATSSTAFSRPEDGGWNPLNLRQFYFVTTDRLDQVADGVGTQIGRTRLWRLTFDDITNPDLGGVIDLLLEGGVGNDGNMWDNLTVTGDNKLVIQEDPGGAAHNAKVWYYDPATGSLTKALQHDPARFGSITQVATAPFNNDEESSGIIDVTTLLGGNYATGQRSYLLVQQAHYTLASPLIEGGQLVFVQQTEAATGPNSSATPYLVAMDPAYNTTAITTVGDNVPKTGGGTYQMVGIPDGMGAYDNGNNTVTLLMNHELGNTSGGVRAHGAAGAFVSEWIINKSTLAVVSASDLITSVYGWDNTNQVSNAAPTTTAFNRFCSADLPPVSAFYNSATGLGTQERIYMNGEEGGTTGWAVAHVATGASKGKSYILGKFNLATNLSGINAVGGWENLVASPYVQDKTVVIGTNDGGTGIMNNSVSVYVGTKTSVGTDADKAGLNNGVQKFVTVTGNIAEVVDTNTRATNITSGTRFSLSATSSTAFSRPEDGAWNPLNPRQFYFVTTDRLDQVADGLGSQIGRTRLWRLTFDDITNPDLGGVIDLLVSGGVGNDGNMWDNMAVAYDGKLLLQEDVGGAPHGGKIWSYDPATGELKKVLRHDTSRFGDVVNTVTFPAVSPFNNDEESSGIIDVTDMFGGNTAAGEHVYFAVVQAHYTLASPLVEGGQLLLVRNKPQAAFSLAQATASVNETVGAYTLTVNRYGDLSLPATASISTINGTAVGGADFTALSSFSLAFTAGQASRTVNISITDRVGEGPASRVFTARVTGTNGATTGAPQDVAITINSVQSPVQSWRQTFFGTTANSGQTADGADFDGDGITNLTEYALGLNPTLGTGANGLAGLPVPSSNDPDSLLSDRLSLSFVVDNTTPADITYIVQAGNDLGVWTDVAQKVGNGAWTWLGGGTARIVTAPSGGRTSVKVGDTVARNPSNPLRFMRLRVTRP